MKNTLDFERDSIGFFGALALALGFMLIAFVGCFFLAGCKSVKSYGPLVVEALFGMTTNVVETASTVTNETESASTENDATDEVEFASLRWEFGGFNGAGGKLKEGATISNLQMSSNGLHFDSVKNVCVALGAKSTSDTDSILVCFFAKDSSGDWRGGKFDWIADNRGNSRGLNHITGSTPYSNWSDSWIPNPCESAFLLINSTTKERSNALKGVWKR